MTDIRNLGGPGQAVFDTAQRLQKSGLIDDAQLKELTNDKVGPQDVAIGNEALNRLQSNTPDAMKLLSAIPKMNNDILTLQRQALQKTVGSDQKPAEQRSDDKMRQVQQHMQQFLDLIARTPPSTVIQPIRQ